MDHTRAFECFKQAADSGVAETQYVKTGFIADNSSLKLLFQLPDFAQGAFVQGSASEIYVEAETVTVMLSPSAEAVNVATPVAKDTEFCDNEYNPSIDDPLDAFDGDVNAYNEWRL